MLNRLRPDRFLFDPSRMTPEIREIPGGRRLTFKDASGVLDFEAEFTLFGGAGGQAYAAFVPRSPGLLRALGAFARKHHVGIPARFDRRWSDRDDPETVAAALDDMIRKTLENMHMVHTAAPALLPAFPLEYLATANAADASAGAVPAEPLDRWLRHLHAFLPEGAPILDRDDRSRLLRNLMTDERLLERPGDAGAIMAEVSAAIRRANVPREEWLRGDDGEPLRPAPVSLVLARLTNIRWMNETANVYEIRRRAGLRSSFGTFVTLLAALSDEAQGAESNPSCAAASAAARLVNWMTAHLNFYPPDGLGHKSDRIDFITTRLLFEEILNPFYAACVLEGREDLRHLPPPERRRILRALRDGFLHESTLPRVEKRGWADRLGALFGRTPVAALSLENVAPLFLFLDQAPHFFAPLREADTAVSETFLYGVGRSISDGKEYWSEIILKRNRRVLQALGGGVGTADSDGHGAVERAVQIALAVAGPPARWEDLSPRDQAYITTAELSEPGFRVLPADWRLRVKRGDPSGPPAPRSGRTIRGEARHE